MKAKEWLKEFCMQKDNAIGDNVSCFNMEDLDEIDDWKDKCCLEVANTIKNNVHNCTCDSQICPWCIYLDFLGINKCEYCGYGIRHGLCHDTSSDYIEIFKYLGGYIHKQINLKDLPIMKEKIE